MTVRGLVGDIGGTRARFACVDERGRCGPTFELPTAELRDLESALRTALPHLGVGSAAGLPVSIAVAAPVLGDDVVLTNSRFRFSIEGTRRVLGLSRLAVLNDLAATAMALPGLSDADFETWRPGELDAEAPKVVVGVGTGLGVGILVRGPERWIPVASEGGHRDLAARDDREWKIVQALAARFGHVSAERALSGPGLVALYEVLCGLDGREAERLDPVGVAAGARAGDRPACGEACRRFSGWLGSIAGDLALTLGARGGLYLTGGVLAGLGESFDRELFLARMEDKGRFREYLGRIPVRRVTTPHAALLGAAVALSS